MMNRRTVLAASAAAPLVTLPALSASAPATSTERVNALIAELGKAIGELESVAGGKWQVHLRGEGAEVTHKHAYRIYDVP